MFTALGIGAVSTGPSDLGTADPSHTGRPVPRLPGGRTDTGRQQQNACPTGDCGRGRAEVSPSDPKWHGVYPLHAPLSCNDKAQG